MCKVIILFVCLAAFPAFAAGTEITSSETQAKPDSFEQNTAFTKEDKEKLVKFLPNYKKENNNQ